MVSYAIRDIKIVNIIDRAEKDMRQLKSTQFVGKKVLATKTSVAGELYRSADGWGFPGGPPSPPNYQYVLKTVTFKADKQISPYGRLLMEFLKSDGVTPATESDGISLFYFNFIVTHVDDGLMKWAVDIRSPGATKFYVRFSVAATDNGVVTAADTVV